MTTEAIEKRAKDLVAEFMRLHNNDMQLIQPRYVGNIIKSEEDIAKQTFLPLFYIWNEDQQQGTFTLSINGNIVEYLLEALCEKTDPSFVPARNEIIAAMKEVTQQTVVHLCSHFNAFPSEMF